jgi:hypothetical protein
MGHTIAEAMARGELDEEEAYFILRFAGHYGYKESIERMKGNPLKRARRWLAWIGGWETPELLQWDEGWPAMRPFRVVDGKVKLNGPTPVSLFGHRVTIQHFGFYMRVGGGYLCFYNDPKRIFWSPNATDHHPDTIVLAGKRRP